MPHSSRRPRVPSDRYGRGAERGTQRRGRAPAKYPRAPQARRVAPQSQLDLALDAAAAAPQPTPATFAELGLDARWREFLQNPWLDYDTVRDQLGPDRADGE